MTQTTTWDTGKMLKDELEVWLYRYKQNSVKAATFDRLVSSLRFMSEYPIAYVRLFELDTEALQRHINRLVDDGYGYSTIKKQHDLVSAFVRYLVGEGVAIRPIYLNAVLPSPDMVQKKPREIAAYTKPEQMRLVNTARENGSSGAKAVILMLETGMRIGELLALSWKDIQWERRAIRIHSTLVRLGREKKSFIQEGAKSKSSNRTIPLSKTAMDLLTQMLEENGDDRGLIFHGAISHDKSIYYGSIRKQIQVLCRQANVEFRGIHVFRHTFATNCYYKGCEIKVLSKLLGHANITITYNTYIHLYGDALEEMRAIVE